MSGSVYENSIAYNILKFGSFDYIEDFEENRRFYHKRDFALEVRPHRLMYQVWFQSMSLRYFFEMALFGFSVLFFQYYLSSFNLDLHILSKDIRGLIDYGVLTVSEEGRILVTEDGKRVLKSWQQDDTWHLRVLGSEADESTTSIADLINMDEKVNEEDEEGVWYDAFGVAHRADGTVIIHNANGLNIVNGKIIYTQA